MAEEIVKTLIGRRDVANLPDFGLEGVAVKVDSGAYTSSIHVTICQEIEKNGEKKIGSGLLGWKSPCIYWETNLFYYISSQKSKKLDRSRSISFLY